MQNLFDIDNGERENLGITKCASCGRLGSPDSPKLLHNGSGGKRILLVGSQPTKKDDETGTLANSSFWTRVELLLRSHNIHMLRDCWIMNSVACHGASPNPKHIECCNPALRKFIDDNNPRLILAFGMDATRALLDWKKDFGGIQKWRGFTIPQSCYVCPMFGELDFHEENEAVNTLFRMDFENALSMYGMEPPQISCEVEVSDDIEYFMDKPVVAFDYETTGLKPDASGHRIVSCSLSDGDRTIAFMLDNRNMERLKTFLVSDVAKVAANMKFEEAWSRVYLGVKVKNWLHDTMLMSHVLDNRRGITSVKFQAYVRYGISDYDSEIAPFLKAEVDNGNAFNRIDEIPVDKLLEYNGMDAFIEYHVYQDQMKEYGL
jgi:uracil-DNA glycosylase family 4